MLSNAAIAQKGKLRVKDGRPTRTRRVKVAPRVAPPSGWQPKIGCLNRTGQNWTWVGRLVKEWANNLMSYMDLRAFSHVILEILNKY